MYKILFVALLTSEALLCIDGDKFSDKALKLWGEIKSGTVPKTQLDDFEKKFETEPIPKHNKQYKQYEETIQKRLETNFGGKTLKEIKEKVSMPGLVLLSRYATSFYKTMNSLTRDIYKNERNPAEDEAYVMKWLGRVAVVSDTLTKLKSILPFKGTVYRFEREWIGWKEKYDGTFNCDTITSTTKKSKAPEGIKDTQLKIEMKVRSGVDVSMLSRFPEEEEVIIPIWTCFKVEKVEGYNIFANEI